MKAIPWNVRRFLLVLGFFTLVPLGLTQAQQSDEDPGSMGSETIMRDPDPDTRTGEVNFDNSSTYVLPENLPIVDEYVDELATMTEAEIADDMEAIVVTPDGGMESLPASPEEIHSFLEAIEAYAEALGAEGEPPVDDLGDADWEEVEIESVIGADNRKKVTNTKVYPFSTVGRIDIGCTGTLIGPRHVLTAGHCVYNISTDKWYSKLNFTPGQNGTTKPYGTIGWKKVLAPKGWTKKHKRNYDYAMIILKEDIGKKVGSMGYGWKDPMPKYNININGYPGDKPSGTMWHSFCELQIIQPHRLYYACDTYGGNSGSAVYVYWKSSKKRIIYGIHAYGVDSTGLNGATRITKSVFKNLKKWKSTY